jgi:hypothetical protein
VLDGPWEFQEIEVPRFHDSRPMKVEGYQPYTLAAFIPQKIFLIFISVSGWVNPRAILQPERLCYWNFPVTPSGIKPATIQLVVQCLNHLCHHMPPIHSTYSTKFSWDIARFCKTSFLWLYCYFQFVSLCSILYRVWTFYQLIGTSFNQLFFISPSPNSG